MIVQITIPGEPQGKGRARVVYNKNLGHTMAYTPEKTVMYENLIKTCYTEQGGQHLGEGPLTMHIKALYPIPKSTSRKKAELMGLGQIRPTKKPDTDNIAKVVADSLNGIAYKDDSQIVALNIEKYYSEIPGVVLTLSAVS